MSAIVRTDELPRAIAEYVSISCSLMKFIRKLGRVRRSI